MSNWIGRPPKYTKPEEMQKIIMEYFEECKAEGKYPTVSMMAFRLGMSRKVLLEYEKSLEDDEYLKQLDESVKREFSNTIKAAKQYIEGCYEDKLINSPNSPIGTIFTLKNNYNWKDKQEIEQTNKTISVELEE